MTTEDNKELPNSGAAPVNEISAVDAVNVIPEQSVVPVDNFQQSSVLVSGGGDKKAPVWFYGLFMIVLIIFIFMTYLTYQSLGKSISIPWIKTPAAISPPNITNTDDDSNN